MVFRSRVDNFFAKFIFVVILVLGAVTFWPLLLVGGTKLASVLTMTLLFIVMVGVV